MTDEKKPHGTVQAFKDARGRKYFRARITLPDGERVWLAPRFDKRDRAEDFAATKTAEADKRGITLAKMAPTVKASGDTCDKWHANYLIYCKERGLSTTGDKFYRWSKWVSPLIGSKAMASVSREDVEGIRDALDEAIRAGIIRAKTAQNVWAEVTSSFAEACSSKRPNLRARQDNPTSGVQAPERGESRSKVYPYPSEFLAVAACEAIPLEWREIHAIAAYTAMRPGELWALTWADVDVDDQRIDITKAWDFKNGRVKSTKTGEARSIPIEPNLLPLLALLKKRAKGKGLVCPVLAASDANKLAKVMRAHFELAGVARARLYRNADAERHVVFRSWRDAGCTWSIVRGDDVVKVQRRAGHRLIATTMRYVVEAENRGASFGQPFPVLPGCLLSSKPLSKESADDEKGRSFQYRRRDSKTPTDGASEPLSAGIVDVKPEADTQPVNDNPAMSGHLDAGLDALQVMWEAQS